MKKTISGIIALFPTSGLGKRLSQNALYNVGGWGFVLLSNLLAMPYIINKLGTEEYGVYTIITSVVSYLGLLELGLGSSVVKYVAHFHAQNDFDSLNRTIGSVIIVQGILGLLGGFAVFALAESISTWLLKARPDLLPISTLCFRISAIGVVFSMLSGPLSGVSQGLQRYGLYNLSFVLQGFLNPAISVLLVYKGYGILSLVVLNIFLMGGIGFLNLLLTKRMIPTFRLVFFKDRANLGKLFSFGLDNFLGRVSYIFNTQFIRFVIGVILGASAVTFFTVSSKLAIALAGLFSTATNVVFPAASTVFSNNEYPRLDRLFRKASTWIAVSAVVPFAILAIFSKQILTLWVGDDLAEHSYRLQSILAIAHFVYVLSMVPNSMALGAGMSRIVGLLSVLTAITVGSSLFFTLRWLNIVGAGVSVLLGSIVGLIICYHVSRRFRQLTISAIQFGGVETKI